MAGPFSFVEAGPSDCESIVCRMIDRVRRFVFSCVIITAISIFSLLLLNLACSVAISRYPSFFRTAAERALDEQNVALSERTSPHLAEWLGLKPGEDLKPYFDELHRPNAQGLRPFELQYEDFTGYRQAEVKGEYFNFDKAGYRHVRNQGPWPIDKSNYNIFVFGSSIVMGTGADWAAIPSYLQEQLSTLNGKPVKVYNFARGFYFSTLERIEFEQLILAGHVPDAVIFADGVNEFFFHDGRPHRWQYFQRAFELPSFNTLDSIKARVQSLAIAKAAAAISDRIFAVTVQPQKVEPVSSSELNRAADRYTENTAMAEAVARRFNIIPLFVWMPFAGYHYDQAAHIALNPLVGYGEYVHSIEGYEIMAKRRPENLLWLADMQTGRTDPLYLDAVHYNAGFSSDVVKAIAGFVRERIGK